MKNAQSAPHRDGLSRALIFYAAGGAGLVEAAHIGAHLPRGIPFSGRAFGVLLGFLFTLFAALSIGGAVRFVLLRCMPEQRMNALIARPGRGVLSFLSTAPPEAEALDTAVEKWGKRAVGLLGLLVWTTVAVWAVVRAFEEPFRIALLIGATVSVTAPFFVVTLPRLAVRPAWVHGLSRRLESARVRRILMGGIAAGAVAAGVSVLIKRDAIFGARDPLPLAVLLFFVLAISALAPFADRLPRKILSGPLFWGAAVASLMLGVGIAAAFPTGRVVLETAGALSGTVYRGAYRALDADGDGFAWLLGGDCHPFDEKSSPFAAEVPGNGYDEDCDGSDEAVRAETRFADFGKADSRLRHRRGNVLLIISDATAAGHLQAYGYGRNTMPAVERFAKNAVLFEHHFAVGNHTSIAMPAMLTGQYPSAYPAALSNGWHSFGLEKRDKPVQVRLGRAGYDTHMYAGHTLSGFVRHFTHLKNGKGERMPAEALAEALLKKLRSLEGETKKSIFAAIHFIDPHHPYRAPEKPDRFGKGARNAYDAELAYVDGALKNLLKLMGQGEFREWLVLFTSDHGEAFGEHGTTHHGFSLFDEEVRVPWIVRVPGAKPGRVSTPTSHLDVLPTILDWCGLPPDETLVGRSVLPLLTRKGTPKRSPRRVVFSEFFRTGHVFGAFDGRYALFYSRYRNSYELYDGETDPGQQHNIYDPDRKTELEALLNRHIAASSQRMRAAADAQK